MSLINNHIYTPQIDCALRAVLDRHAPVTRRKVGSRRSAPWYATVREKLRDAKKQRRSAEKKWLSSGFVVFKQIYSAAKKRVTQIILFIALKLCILATR